MAGLHVTGPLVVSGVEVISAAGAITGDIQATAGSIGTTELANNAVTMDKLAHGGVAGDIIVAATSTLAPTYVAVSGDATLASTGALTIANNAITNVKILDGTIAASKLASAMSAIETVAVTVTNSQIIGMLAAPKTLVAAGGAGTVIQFLGAILVLDYGGTNVFTETDDNFVVRYENTTGAIVSEVIEGTGFINQAADTMTNAIPKKDAIVVSASAINKPLVLNVTGHEIAGNVAADNTMKVYVTYRTITL